MKVISEFYEEEQKCASCNWRSPALFAFEGDDIDEAGLCGWCLSKILANGELRIIEGGLTPPECREQQSSERMKSNNIKGMSLIYGTKERIEEVWTALRSWDSGTLGMMEINPRSEWFRELKKQILEGD